MIAVSFLENSKKQLIFTLLILIKWSRTNDCELKRKAVRAR